MPAIQVPITEKRYPRDPDPEQLPELYNSLREDALTLTRSRGQFVGIVSRQKETITELQVELQQFSQDMATTLQQKAELTKIINGYAEVIKELETAGGNLTEAFEKSGRMGVWNIPLLEALRAFVNTWKLSTSRAKTLSAQKAIEQSDVDS
tara:strand:+ start:246 stop:698 length:453 start_codon:yes stop_codon:yes gene_type:complete